jgi:type IV pilus assembly protein PilC
MVAAFKTKRAEAQAAKPGSTAPDSVNLRYEGYNLRSGDRVEGMIQARDEIDAKTILREQGIVVDTITGAGIFDKLKTQDLNFGGSNKIKTAELASFCRTFAVSTGSGIPPARALDMIAKEEKDNSALGIALRDIHRQVLDGAPLTEAFEAQQDKFGELTIAMISAGEQSATLDKTLTRLADMTERSVRLRRKLIGSMAYPAVIMTLSLLVVVAALIFVVPQFDSTFKEFGGELPALTKTLVNLSDMLRTYWFLLPGVPFLMLQGWRKLKKNQELGERLDSFVLKAPVFGKIIQLATMARVADVLATLLQAGVPQVRAIELASKASGNRAISAAFDRAREKHAGGVKLSHALEGEPVVVPQFKALVAQGEASSEPEILLARYAEMTEGYVDAKITAMTEMIQPVLMLLIMGLVGFMAIALYMPIISIYDQFTTN